MRRPVPGTRTGLLYLEKVPGTLVEKGARIPRGEVSQPADRVCAQGGSWCGPSQPGQGVTLTLAVRCDIAEPRGVE
jgi:hypothetical protein